MRATLAVAVLALATGAAAHADTALRAQGHQLLAAGQFEAAATAFRNCLSAAPDAATGVDCETGLGLAALFEGNLTDAGRHFDRAREQARQPARQRSIALARGKLATYQARFNDADALFDGVIATAESAGDNAAVARAWLGKAATAAEQLNRGALRQALEQSLAAAANVPDPALRLRLELSAVDALLRSEAALGLANWDLNMAAAAGSGALRRARALEQPRDISLAAGLLGEVYLRAGRLDEAASLSQLATFQSQSIDAPELSYRWRWLSGRVLKAQGNLPLAAEALDQAVGDLAQVRSSLLSGLRGRRQPFRQLVGPLFQDHADALLTQAATAAVGEAQTLRRRARQVIEAFKSAELQDYFLDDCVVNVEAQDTTLDAVGARTAVVYPVLLEDRTEVLVSIEGVIHQFRVDTGAEPLGRVAQQFRRALERRSSHQYRPLGRRLYDWLLRDAEPLLADAGVETLVFVPDGALRNIPLAALHDGEQFLIQRYAVAITPGLNLTDPQPISRQSPRILLNGLTEAVQGFPALPSVAFELESLRDLYPDQVTVLQDQAFVAGNVSEEISRRPFNVVHFASHGEFQADVSESFLLTFDDRLNMNQLDEFMQLRRFSDEPVELLTLSACRTAAGDDRAALGLAGIAIRAGARSALGTLWYINDQATSELIARFYGELRTPENTKAEALRLAQLSLLEDRRYQHPGYWAPFLLIGNWL
ncbi:MAG: CHAT domain-containing protein [Pseudomonadota bacterium]